MYITDFIRPGPQFQGNESCEPSLYDILVKYYEPYFQGAEAHKMALKYISEAINA